LSPIHVVSNGVGHFQAAADYVRGGNGQVAPAPVRIVLKRNNHTENDIFPHLIDQATGLPLASPSSWYRRIDVPRRLNYGT
jgi:hypothetical protein